MVAVEMVHAAGKPTTIKQSMMVVNIGYYIAVNNDYYWLTRTDGWHAKTAGTPRRLLGTRLNMKVLGLVGGLHVWMY